MGLLDWIGPTSLAKRRGWDRLPAVPPAAKSSPRVERWVGLGPGGHVFYTPTALASPASASGTAGNSAVFACLQALATAVVEPELRVYRTADGDKIEQAGTELGSLLARPNPYFSLDMLTAYATACLHVDGNAYWRKLRSGHPERGNVVELWPVSPSSIEPVSNGADFISYYRYTAQKDGRTESLAPGNVIHFRYGLDDRDHRLGVSPLKRLVREVSSDDQATRYADRLLANLAVNGLSLEFDKDAPPIDQATADELKARIASAYGGDNVGSTAVLSPGAKLVALGFSPEQLDLKTLHRVPEERISAVLGVPAIVAGLGAGLDRATYANFKEAREAWTEAKLIPFWGLLASTVTLQLVPDFTADETLVEFDLSTVRALADDDDAKATRLSVLVGAGILTTDEARAEIGYGPKPEQEAPPAPVPVAAEAEQRSLLDVIPIRKASPSIARWMAVESKAAADLPDRFGDMRERALPDWERELITFLDQQLARVTRRLRAGAESGPELVPEGEAILLGEVLTPLQVRQLGDVARAVMAEMGIRFEVDDPATREYLRVAGEHIVGITDTTRSAVQEAMLAGQADGEGIEVLARRLRELPAFGDARARVVARTELGHSQNAAALASYAASGVVVGIRVHDGDYDAACQEIDGQVFPLDAPPPTLQHPNCVRAFAPLTDAADLAEAS